MYRLWGDILSEHCLEVLRHRYENYIKWKLKWLRKYSWGIRYIIRYPEFIIYQLPPEERRITKKKLQFRPDPENKLQNYSAILFYCLLILVIWTLVSTKWAFFNFSFFLLFLKHYSQCYDFFFNLIITKILKWTVWLYSSISEKMRSLITVFMPSYSISCKVHNTIFPPHVLECYPQSFVQMQYTRLGKEKW